MTERLFVAAAMDQPADLAPGARRQPQIGLPQIDALPTGEPV